jgi:hypothetical protein
MRVGTSLILAIAVVIGPRFRPGRVPAAAPERSPVAARKRCP